ncbi:CatB-related O-acetyltransferase [Vibrio sp. 10N.222.54.B6]|uniref:CatB-related O-acetyltransferase n=1 Tax=Vibrio sp. 10N.222.54.B6 TaxID=1884468 RepID=UPI0018E4B587|nr:CatB-related O-acetyltransferase [Vibrio sp. 10N.222.54.B6]
MHTWGSKDEKLVIGNYVSIASGVKFFLGGEHQTNTITTFPFKVKVLGHDVEAFSKGPIIIEDDVWIGTDVKIMSGVRVGKGAVIAAGSIVTNDVLPYSIVGGVPARFIKSRVPSELIDELATLDIKNIEHLIIDDLDLIYSELDSETLDRINLSLAKINRI